MLLQWAVAAGFTGFIIAIIVQFNLLTKEQQTTSMRFWLIVAVILVGFATFVQLTSIIFG